MTIEAEAIVSPNSGSGFPLKNIYCAKKNLVVLKLQFEGGFT